MPRLNGIIPAYAGSTYGLDEQAVVDRGSSPHTRGARYRHLAGHSGLRDHPRIRGEHLGLASLDAQNLGIIPAYAGSTWQGIQDFVGNARIIPAYAGSTRLTRFTVAS